MHNLCEILSASVPWIGLSMEFGIGLDSRAITQAVSRWLPTVAARVRSRVWSSRICGGQSGAGADFLRVLQFPMPIFIPPNSPSSYSPGAGYNRPMSGRRAEWAQLDSTPPTDAVEKRKWNYDHQIHSQSSYTLSYRHI
jgi:hypothetical protein